MTVIRIDGEVDVATVPAFETALERAARQVCKSRWICSRLTYFDSTGIPCLRHVPHAQPVSVPHSTQLRNH
ncbi:MAG: STAS domain-containing protein [bacterium]